MNLPGPSYMMFLETWVLVMVYFYRFGLGTPQPVLSVLTSSGSLWWSPAAANRSCFDEAWELHRAQDVPSRLGLEHDIRDDWEAPNVCYSPLSRYVAISNIPWNWFLWESCVCVCVPQPCHASLWMIHTHCALLPAMEENGSLALEQILNIWIIFTNKLSQILNFELRLVF